MSINSQHAKNERLLLKWWLVTVKLMRKTTSLFNLWPYSISWNLVGLWYIFGAWKSFLIFWKWKTFYVNVRWISMLFLDKWVFVKYKTLVVKMHNDLHIMATTNTNLQYLCDIVVVMGLACIMPLLESIRALFKFMQARHTFVWKFVIVVKMWCVELYNMDSYPEKKYGAKQLKVFLYENNNDQLLTAWWINYATKI